MGLTREGTIFLRFVGKSDSYVGKSSDIEFVKIISKIIIYIYYINWLHLDILSIVNDTLIVDHNDTEKVYH